MANSPALNSLLRLCCDNFGEHHLSENDLENAKYVETKPRA